MLKNILSVKYLSLVILLLLTALSYHPSFSQFVTEKQGVNPLNKYIYIALAVTLILHFQIRKIMKSSFIRFYIIYSFLIAAFGYFLLAMNYSDEYITEAKNCIMAFSFMLIGYNANLNLNQLLFLLITYGSAVLYSTFMQIMVNLGGFTLSAIYLQYGKNILGVMTSSSSVAMAFLCLVDNRKWVKIITAGFAVLLLAFTITIRARAAFLSTFLILGFLFYRKMKSENKMTERIIKFTLFTLIALLTLSLFSDTISNIFGYIYESFTLNQGNDITSDRMNRNEYALNIIANHILFGNLEVGAKYDWVHNYFLRHFSSYGIIAGFPILALYLHLFCFVIKNAIKRKFTPSTIGYVVFLIPIIISMEEPTFPYAPGTGTILSFTMLGYSIRNELIQTSNKKSCIRLSTLH